MHNEAHTDNDLIPTVLAAEILGRSASTVNRMAASHRLPYAAKVPGLRGGYLFRRADVERLAAERRTA